MSYNSGAIRLVISNRPIILLMNCSPLVISLPTEHLGVLKNLLKRVHVFQIELEFGRFFLRRGENWSTQKKPLGAKERTNNKVKPHMA